VQVQVQVQVQVLLITSPSESLDWWYRCSFAIVCSTLAMVAFLFLAEPFSSPGPEEREKGTRDGVAVASNK
jgi:hypothetical protein